MSRDAMDEIRREVAANKVLIYMKGTPEAPRCGFSARAAGILSSLGVPFASVDILADPDKLQALRTFSDWPTTPQIYIGGEFLGGGDQLAEANASGELRRIVDAAVAG